MDKLTEYERLHLRLLTLILRGVKLQATAPHVEGDGRQKDAALQWSMEVIELEAEMQEAVEK